MFKAAIARRNRSRSFAVRRLAFFRMRTINALRPRMIPSCPGRLSFTSMTASLSRTLGLPELPRDVEVHPVAVVRQREVQGRLGGRGTGQCDPRRIGEQNLATGVGIHVAQRHVDAARRAQRKEDADPRTRGCPGDVVVDRRRGVVDLHLHQRLYLSRPRCHTTAQRSRQDRQRRRRNLVSRLIPFHPSHQPKLMAASSSRVLSSRAPARPRIGSTDDRHANDIWRRSSLPFDTTDGRCRPIVVRG